MLAERPLGVKVLAPYKFDVVHAPDPTSVYRRLTVSPSMCGNNNLLVGRIGDWTWEAVSHCCNINAFRAFDASGAPAYLSFYFIEIIGSSDFPINALTFGDKLDVTSSCYGLGSESVVTFHRLSQTGAGQSDPVTPAEMLEAQRSKSIYAQTINRWIARQDQSNDLLKSATPADFCTDGLPLVPDDLSPRRVYDRARRNQSFADDHKTKLLSVEEFKYRIEPAQDLNGVGLLHFASYFSIASKAISSSWLAYGRSIDAYLTRKLLAERMLYLGNADAGSELTVTVALRQSESGQSEHADVRLMQSGTDRLLAVAEFVSEYPR